MRSSFRRHPFTRRRFCGGLLSLSLISRKSLLAASAEPPVVFQKIDPVQPGQVLMVFGNALKDAHVTGAPLADGEASSPPRGAASFPSSAIPLAVLQADDRCLKIEIPASWKIGNYVLRVESSAGSAKNIFVNRPEIWWALSDQGDAATAGAQLRVLGKNFVLNRSETTSSGKAALLDAQGTWFFLQTSAVNPYAFTVQLPPNAALGTAQILAHNSHGGLAGWSEPHSIEIRKAAPWPDALFNVQDFGAKGDSKTDDTAAINAALLKCRAQGGGVVFLPHGIYRVTAQLTIPERTVLKGESRELVWLMVPHEQPEFNTLIAGGNEFAVEDLSMAARLPLRMITAPDVDSMYHEEKPWGRPGSSRVHDVFLRRLRVEHLRYEGRLGPATKDPRRLEDAGPSTIALAGSNLEISGCEIVSSGMPFVLHRPTSTRVSGNILHTGRNGWYGFWGAEEVVFEKNTIRGQDMEASYGGFGNYVSEDGPNIHRVYVAENNFLDGFGDEREALTFDSAGIFPWKGRVSQAGANDLSASGTNWQTNELAGMACIITAGRGLGQHRRIVSNSNGQLIVDRPWDVIPDAASAAAVGPFRRDVVVYRNDSQDASVGVQLWGGGYNSIIDSNTTRRSGGFWATASEYDVAGSGEQHIVLPCYFTQWLNNTVKEAFAYDGQEAAPFSNWATVGIMAREVSTTADAAVLIYGNLFRGNLLFDHSQILLGYTWSGYREHARKSLTTRPPVGLDNVIEGNSITDAPVGIEIEIGFEGTLIRNNHYERVDQQVLQAT